MSNNGIAWTEETVQFEQDPWRGDDHEELRTSMPGYRGPWLRKDCPEELSQVTAIGLDKGTNYLKVVMRASSGDVQYALLQHFYKIVGLVTAKPKPKCMTQEEKVRAYNLYQKGMPMSEISRLMGHALSTIWKWLPDEMNTTGYAKIKTKSYTRRLRQIEKRAIDIMHGKMTNKAIAEKLGIPHRQVRYYLYESNNRISARQSRAGAESPA